MPKHPDRGYNQGTGHRKKSGEGTIPRADKKGTPELQAHGARWIVKVNGNLLLQLLVPKHIRYAQVSISDMQAVPIPLRTPFFVTASTRRSSGSYPHPKTPTACGRYGSPNRTMRATSRCWPDTLSCPSIEKSMPAGHCPFMLQIRHKDVQGAFAKKSEAIRS